MNQLSIPTSQRLFFFGIIGITALIAHLIAVWAQVRLLSVQPLIANIFAFLFAFNVSYVGHKRLTFARLGGKQLQRSHFFLVAASAGLLNEGLYYVFLRFTRLDYVFSLLIVIALVSVYTFILSRYWACR